MLGADYFLLSLLCAINNLDLGPGVLFLKYDSKSTRFIFLSFPNPGVQFRFHLVLSIVFRRLILNDKYVLGPISSPPPAPVHLLESPERWVTEKTRPFLLCKHKNTKRWQVSFH